MKDDFEKYRQDWQVNSDSFPHLQDVQVQIEKLRKKRRTRIILWYSAVIFFCLMVILYVLYTDELNSLYKSISEFLLLFACVFAFQNSWKNINHQNREYLLSNVEFIQNFKSIEQQIFQKKLINNFLFISILSISIFLHFLESLSVSSINFWMSSAVLLVINLVIWLIIKPVFERKNKVRLQEFVSLIKK